jgi:hypothetical protein
MTSSPSPAPRRETGREDDTDPLFRKPKAAQAFSILLS